MTTVILKRDKLTCPLTCSKCGEVILRGEGMAWNRKPNKKGVIVIAKFWHSTLCPKKSTQVEKAGGKN